MIDKHSHHVDVTLVPCVIKHSLNRVYVPVGRQFVLNYITMGQKQKFHLYDPHEIQASVFESCRDGND